MILAHLGPFLASSLATTIGWKLSHGQSARRWNRGVGIEGMKGVGGGEMMKSGRLKK